MPDLPECLSELWRAFSDLSQARGQTGFGGAPITYVDIVQYQRAYRIRLTPWEIATIKELDAVWIADQADQARAERESRANR